MHRRGRGALALSATWAWGRRGSIYADAVTVVRSIVLFVLAAVAEIGGAWLVWQGVREHRGSGDVRAGTLAAAVAGGAPDRSFTVHLTEFVYRGQADPSAPGGVTSRARSRRPVAGPVEGDRLWRGQLDAHPGRANTSQRADDRTGPGRHGVIWG